MWPADEHGRCDSYILLKPSAGTAWLKAWTQEIKILPQETEVVVPSEAEPGWIDYGRFAGALPRRRKKAAQLPLAERSGRSGTLVAESC
ncbi:hypothetical protein [Streptomyces sp. NPDC058695]|uniref:hypothetical protein n=1 Tax=Streptomyces sp. NPDC058695 TaxID=3346604 RepID=UPI00365C4D61